MTQLPFEDPISVAQDFNHFWSAYPRKCGKLKAIVAYGKALKLATHDEIMAGVRRYLTSKPAYADWAHPTTWLTQGRWMDEPDTKRQPPPNDGALRIIAAHAKQPWCERGKYTRARLQQCVDAGLLTAERMEEIS